MGEFSFKINYRGVLNKHGGRFFRGIIRKCHLKKDLCISQSLFMNCYKKVLKNLISVGKSVWGLKKVKTIDAHCALERSAKSM